MLSEVKFRCGHTGMMDLTGQAEERAKKVRWYAKHVICPDCRLSAAMNKWDTLRKESAFSPEAVPVFVQD